MPTGSSVSLRVPSLASSRKVYALELDWNAPTPACTVELVAIPGQYGSRPLSGTRKPKESRRWLKPRVPREQLYRLAPARPRPKRLGRVELTDRVRQTLRAWWLWLGFALLLYAENYWLAALIPGAVSFILYHVSTESHPAAYPLEPGLEIDSPAFRTAMSGTTGMPFVPGNRVVIYNNGDEFFPAMLEAVESAKRSVTMEQYIYWDGAVGRRFAEAFAQKARQGVPVKLLLDAIGSSTLGREIFRILEAGGCQLAWYRPIHWYTLSRGVRRDHRKSIIVDGRLAFTGGAGLADHWLGTAANEKEWRDIQISVEGPAAQSLQTGFAQNWLAATGEIVTGPAFFPDDPEKGEVEVQTILSSPVSGAGAVGTMYLIALQSAKRFIYIANPYFIPDSRLIELFAHISRRGITVKLMLAGEHNDTWWARQNSVRKYGQLLEAGVEIYEFQPTMLHQKTMVVDGLWATVGTANFDNRSFALNEESNVCFHDPALVDQLCAAFLADLTRCRAIRLSDWKRRGIWQKAKEQWASLVEDQM
jgi:cardiolipin synthase